MWTNKKLPRCCMLACEWSSLLYSKLQRISNQAIDSERMDTEEEEEAAATTLHLWLQCETECEV